MIEKKEISDPDTLELCGIRVAKIVDLGICTHLYREYTSYVYISGYVFRHFACIGVYVLIYLCVHIFMYMNIYIYIYRWYTIAR
jgi:small basic protein